MLAFHVPHGIVSRAGQIVRQRWVVLRPGERDLGGCLRCGINGAGGLPRGLFRAEVLDDTQGDFEDAGLDDLDLDVRSQRGSSPALRGNLLVHVLHGLAQFPTDPDPFHGPKVVVLEEHHQRCGTNERCVLPQKL